MSQYERALLRRGIQENRERIERLERPVAWRWCHRNEIEPKLWHYSETPVEATELVMVEALAVVSPRRG